MPRSIVPSLRFHAATGQHYVYARRRRHYLGSDPAIARQRYAKFVASIHSPDPVPVDRNDAEPLTVAEAMLLYLQHARKEHASQPKSIRRLQIAIAALLKVFPSADAAAIRGPAVKRVRETLLARKPDGEQLSRKYVNALIDCIRLAFKWLVSEDLVPADNLVSISAIGTIRAGRGGREAIEVEPVDEATVDATLPFCTPTVADMIRVQRLTGCRPGELCSLKRCDISTSGSEPVKVPRRRAVVTAVNINGSLIWLWVVSSHKTDWRGKPRVIPLLAAVQAVIAHRMSRAPEAYIFTAEESAAEFNAAKRAARKTKVQPSQIMRAKVAARHRHLRRRAPAQHFDTAAYGRSIKKAIARANRERARSGMEPLPVWRPNQLRHSAATLIAERLDDSHAAALLGHSGMGSIANYVKQAVGKAITAAEKLAG